MSNVQIRREELPLPVYRFDLYKASSKVKPIHRERHAILVLQRSLKSFLVKFLRARAKEAAESLRGPGGKLKKALIDRAAHEAATSPRNARPLPTEAQAKAGNYKKGHINISGLDISIENPAGSKRRPEWPALNHHYGYIRGTIGKDKDHVDVFVKPGTPEDYTGPVFVVNQMRADGTFDEHKCMIGWNTELEARLAYLSNYAPGWQGMGHVAEKSWEEFVAWCRSGYQGSILKLGDQLLAELTKAALTEEQRARVDEIMREIDTSGFTTLSEDDEFRTILEAVVREGGVAALDQIGIDDSNITNLVNERANAYAADRSAELVGMRVLEDGSVIENPNAEWRIDDTTRDMLRSVVTRAEQEGWSNDQLSDAIELSPAFSEARADMIARTETAFADLQGNLTAYKESGVVSGKQWIVGAGCCDDCSELDGTVVGLDEDFPNDGGDGPPLHPNCRCDVSPVMNED